MAQQGTEIQQFSNNREIFEPFNFEVWEPELFHLLCQKIQTKIQYIMSRQYNGTCLVFSNQNSNAKL